MFAGPLSLGTKWSGCEIDHLRCLVLTIRTNGALPSLHLYAFMSCMGTILLCIFLNPLNPELNPICYLLALLAHHFLHVRRIRVKSLTLRLLMSYIYIWSAARLLRSWVRIPPGAWIFVCCECRVLSGRGLCDELITRPEESYRLWCVVCNLETSRIGAPYIYIYDIRNLRVNGQCTLYYILCSDIFQKFVICLGIVTVLNL